MRIRITVEIDLGCHCDTPSPATHFRAKADNGMKTVRLNWNLPTTRINGLALPVAAIAASIVSISQDGGQNWTELETVAAPETAHEVTELEDGEHRFRLVIVSTIGRQSAPVYATAIVSSAPVVPVDPLDQDAAPSPATGFTATVL
jgi:hypothetical protein